MWGELLCFFEWHKWIYEGMSERKPLFPRHNSCRICQRCHTMQRFESDVKFEEIGKGEWM